MKRNLVFFIIGLFSGKVHEKSPPGNSEQTLKEVSECYTAITSESKFSNNNLFFFSHGEY